MALNESLARTRAEALHNGGLHCAEAVLLALLEQTPAGGDALVPRMASWKSVSTACTGISKP